MERLPFISSLDAHKTGHELMRAVQKYALPKNYLSDLAYDFEVFYANKGLGNSVIVMLRESGTQSLLIPTLVSAEEVDKQRKHIHSWKNLFDGSPHRLLILTPPTKSWQDGPSFEPTTFEELQKILEQEVLCRKRIRTLEAKIRRLEQDQLDLDESALHPQEASESRSELNGEIFMATRELTALINPPKSISTH